MKPLKILLGNNSLSLLAGSETWTYSLALALKNLGHDVHCFSPQLGIISEKLIEAGVPCFDAIYATEVKPFSFVLEEKIDHNYDVIIANHNHIVDFLRAQFPKKPIISTIHGIMHHHENGDTAPEYPALYSGVNQFVAVSEEVQEKLKEDYGIESMIIRNGFDVERFRKIESSEGKQLQFMVNTNYADRNDPAIVTIREVAKHFGAKVAAIGQNFTQSFDISRAISDSQVVFGMGRSVLEGVAAGRLGIVHGRWGTGGVINESSYEELRLRNFSGRGNVLATKDEIIKMIEDNLNPIVMVWGKEYIARDHNIVLVAEQYIALARELTGQSFSRPAGGGGVDPTAHKFRLAEVSNTL